jgi:hypothetical protein
MTKLKKTNNAKNKELKDKEEPKDKEEEEPKDKQEEEPKDKQEEEPKDKEEPAKIESIDVKPKKSNCVKCIRCVWRTVLNTIQVIIDGVICCCRCTKACIEVIDCDSDDE